MSINKLLLAMALGLVIAACAKAPTGGTVQHGDFNVSKLFTVDGCTVYRFYDSGDFKYFTKCERAESSSISGEEYCGKNCVHKNDIGTRYE